MVNQSVYVYKNKSNKVYKPVHKNVKLSSMFSTLQSTRAESTNIVEKNDIKRGKNGKRVKVVRAKPEDSLRSYSFVDRINSISLIAGRTDVYMATVRGWSVVIKRGAFQLNDRFVYVPTDTIVDTRKPHFSHNKVIQQFVSTESTMRVVPIQVTQTVFSEGIALPLSVLSADVRKVVDRYVSTLPTIIEDSSLDIALGVTKYRKESLERQAVRMMQVAGDQVATSNANAATPTVARSQSVAKVVTTSGQQLTTSRDNTRRIAVVKPVVTVDKILKDLKGVPVLKKDPFPVEIIPKTDESALKNNPKCLLELRDKEIYISKKMDGCSMTLILDADRKFTVCSRHKVCDVGSTYMQFVKSMHIEQKLRSLGYPIAIQCEFCGPNINENQMCLANYDMYVFTAKRLDDVMMMTTGESSSGKTDHSSSTVYNGDDEIEEDEELPGHYYSLSELSALCQQLDVNMVPVLEVFMYTPDWTLKKFQEYANSVTYTVPGTNQHVEAEGIVIRPTENMYSEVLKGNFSVKVINQKYKE